MSRKHDKRNHTEAEMRLQELIESEYQHIMKMIEELLRLTHKTVNEFCASLDINDSTFYRYKSEETRIDLHICIASILILKQFMAEQHIVCPPELKEFINQIDLFKFD